MSPSYAAEKILPVLADALARVPLLPYEGAYRVGYELTDDNLSVYDFAGLELTPGRAAHNYILERALASSEDVDSPNSQDFRDGLGLAIALVQSVTVRSVALLARGDDSLRTEAIDPIDPQELDEAFIFLESKPNRDFTRNLFGAVRDRLAGSSKVQEALSAYKNATDAISRKYLNLLRRTPRFRTGDMSHLKEAKDLELSQQRGILMSEVGPNILAAVHPFAEQRRDLSVVAFAGALACGVPGRKVLDRYSSGGDN